MMRRTGVVACLLLLALAAPLWGQTEERSSEAWTNEGMEQARRGNLDEALVAYTRALEVNPENAAAFNNRGLVYARKGMYRRAIEDYTRSAELRPASIDPETRSV
ncbi:MAG: tetratricopeptide repeat protein, partial [Thermodesulfobacteriota bacterium]